LRFFNGTGLYKDNNIALTQLEKNYLSGIYSEILVDRNKAFATHS
jgi:hypothetical protein